MKKELFVDDLKRIELSLLDTLDDYCKTAGLRYYLTYGTLIGALRHKGFIPWDDDSICGCCYYEYSFELFIYSNLWLYCGRVYNTV